MRLIKTLGLVMVAAIAAMAFVAAGTASASTENTALCSKAELVCPAGSTYGAGTVLKGSLAAGTETVLTGTLAVKCKTSLVEGETTTGSGKTILVKYHSLSWNNCNTCKEIITLVSKSTPKTAHIKNFGGLKASASFLSPTIDLIDCTFLNIDCTASAEEVVLDADTSGATPTVKAINEPLSMAGGFGCGEKTTWNAEFALTAPSPVFIES